MASLLEERGVEHYCPLNKVTKQWSDRRKVVMEPLFKGYVFVQVEEAKKWEVLHVNGILNYVHWLGKPAIVKDEEINTIRKFLNEFENVEVIESKMQVDSEVRVRQGLLMNYHGMILELQGSKAKVRIESMGLQLSAVFDKKNLEVVR